MSRLSFISFCVEQYAKHAHKTSDEIYKLFKDEKVLEFLKEDYDDLHGMGMEYLVHMIDEYLGVTQHGRISRNNTGNNASANLNV